MNFFPEPYQDEILYSVLARYHYRSGNGSFKNTLNDSFGCSSLSAIVELPSNLKLLMLNLPDFSKFSFEELIYNHTLYPYYAPFLSPIIAEKVYQTMIDGQGGSIYARTGLMASSIPLNKYLRFCPECLQEDIVLYGETYWHRIHQIIGVYICPKHKCQTYNSVVEIGGFNKHRFIQADRSNCMTRSIEEIPDSFHDKLIKVALECRWLLDNQIKPHMPEWFTKTYQGLLSQRFKIIRSNVDLLSLARDIESYYSKAFLDLFYSKIDINQNSNWLFSIVRKHRNSFHPIRHILWIGYIKGTLRDFFKDNKVMINGFQPFGPKPWPCLNYAADHYKKSIITNIEITSCSKTRRPVGTFSCSCGFVYSRRGPDNNAEDKYKIGRIKSFGQLWMNKLVELQKQNLSLREMGRKMNVDPGTIKKQIKKLINLKETGEHIESETLNGKKHRDEWLKAQKSFPDLSKTQLRKLYPAIYTWLYRHDKDWLSSNSPEKGEKIYKNNRVNWHDRDIKILEKVFNVVKDYLAGEIVKHKLLSVNYIGKKIRCLALLQKHIDKLPDTKKYLQTVMNFVYFS